MSDAFMIFAVVVFGTGAFGGFFVTGYVMPDLEQWWWPAVIRVVWQLGGAAMVFVYLVRELGGELKDWRGWRAPVGFLAVGLLLSINPLLDLVRGPARVHGHAEIAVDRGGRRIFATVVVTAADGAVTTIDLAGNPANAVERQLAACDGEDDVDLVALRHLGVVLSLSCD